MAKTITKKSNKVFKKGSPLIVHANWFQFRCGEIVRHRCVESRMFLWNIRGKGEIEINGANVGMEPRDWALIPWRHRICYRADSKTPFYVGGIHFIPFHAVEAEPTFAVANTREHPLAGDPARQDQGWPVELAGLVHGRMTHESDPLAMISSYVISIFNRQDKDATILRYLAELLLQEILRSLRSGSRAAGIMPGALQRMINHARSHPQEKAPEVEALARVGQCSVASVHRLFRQHLGRSPAQWMASERAERAASLLNTTTHGVQEVGRLVGFEDPFQFSRFFRKHLGCSPRQYRGAHPRI